jgi:hypothetical protein
MMSLLAGILDEKGLLAFAVLMITGSWRRLEVDSPFTLIVKGDSLLTNSPRAATRRRNVFS